MLLRRLFSSQRLLRWLAISMSASNSPLGYRKCVGSQVVAN